MIGMEYSSQPFDPASKRHAVIPLSLNHKQGDKIQEINPQLDSIQPQRNTSTVPKFSTTMKIDEVTAFFT